MAKILLVEDNDMNQDMLSRRLRRRGYEVIIASDGKVGISMALSQQPDLILMDMSLPVMNGWEATAFLKADKRTANIPIIALTAHAMLGDREKALLSGCDEYDTKPVELPGLLQKMEALLAKHTLPKLTDDRVTPTPLPPSKVVQPSGIGTVLVVDDNDMNRDMLGRRLQRAGYTVLLADGGEAGLEMVRQQQIDLVMLDIMMPGIGGLDTLKLIRDTYSRAQLPVIMATAKDQSDDMVQAFELGANDYVTKPIDFPVVLARIKAQLNTVQAVRQKAAKVVSIDSYAEQIQPKPRPIELVSQFKPVTPLLLGRYKITEKLVQEQSRSTYLVEDTQQSSLCVVEQLKLNIRPDLWTSTNNLFQQEANILKQLSEKNHVARLVDACHEGQHFYLVREFIEGTLLSEELKPGRPQILRTVLSITIDSLKILRSLHQQRLIHQYLQPSCFLRRQQDRQLLLVDFGVVARLSAVRQNHLQAVASSRNMYVPPERYDLIPTFSSDIYAIGMMTLQALTGKLPNQLPSDPETGEVCWRHLVTVGESFAKVLDKMISHNLAEQYTSVAQLLNELYQLPMVYTLLGADVAV